MAEDPVAFPSDEVSAEGIAARLRAAGIAARIDRGLHGSWQLPAQGQITVFVNAKDGARAHKVLGTTAREAAAPGPAIRVVVAVLIAALVLGIVAIAVTLVSRQPDFRPSRTGPVAGSRGLGPRHLADRVAPPARTLQVAIGLWLKGDLP